jgi:hypothetical protein
MPESTLSPSQEVWIWPLVNTGLVSYSSLQTSTASANAAALQPSPTCNRRCPATGAALQPLHSCNQRNPAIIAASQPYNRRRPATSAGLQPSPPCNHRRPATAAALQPPPPCNRRRPATAAALQLSPPCNRRRPAIIAALQPPPPCNPRLPATIAALQPSPMYASLYICGYRVLLTAKLVFVCHCHYVESILGLQESLQIWADLLLSLRLHSLNFVVTNSYQIRPSAFFFVLLYLWSYLAST